MLAFAFGVAALPPVHIVVPSDLPVATAGAFYSFAVTAHGGAGPPYRFAFRGPTRPPANLRLDASTGVLSGTVAANATLGERRFTLCATAGTTACATTAILVVEDDGGTYTGSWSRTDTSSDGMCTFRQSGALTAVVKRTGATVYNVALTLEGYPYLSDFVQCTFGQLGVKKLATRADVGSDGSLSGGYQLEVHAGALTGGWNSSIPGGSDVLALTASR
jgi:hypothetical protein